ncbi:MAG: YfbM family protein [Ruminococcus sp.]|nr:YfbM family protein [Ruminococcus sp.]
MSSLGVLFAVDKSVVEHIRSLKMSGRPEYISNELEELYFEDYPERTCELDKTWEAQHRALTDGSFCFDHEGFPLGMAILGGEILYFDGKQFDDYIITLKTPDEVAQVYSGLKGLSKKDFKKGYEQIDKAEYEDKCDEDFEEAYEYLLDSVPFWRFAAEHKLWVLFTADM